MKSERNRGFTLIELMVVVAIAVIVTVLGVISVTSRTRNAALEQAAEQLASDLSYARSAAMLKGCPVRLVFCPSADCKAATASGVQVISSPSLAYGQGASPWRSYAIMRLSSVSSGDYCYNANAIPAAQDGWNYWDYDRKVQNISKTLKFSPSVYIGSTVGVPDQTDWKLTSSANAGNSIYFRTDGSLIMPGIETVTIPNSSVPHRIVFQVSFNDCDPAVEEDDCPAYLVSIPADGGVARYVKCNPQTRSVGSSGAQPSTNCLP